MIKRILIASALCATAASAASAQTAAQPQPSTRAQVVKALDESFARVDANKDGTISRDEIQSVEAKAEQQANATLQKSLEEQFGKLDSDKNGQLSLAEFKAGAAIRGCRVS